MESINATSLHRKSGQWGTQRSYGTPKTAKLTALFAASLFICTIYRKGLFLAKQALERIEKAHLEPIINFCACGAGRKS
jgi:hypothetical protein